MRPSKPQSKSQPDTTINSELHEITKKLYLQGVKDGIDEWNLNKSQHASIAANEAKTALANLIAQEANKARIDELKRVEFVSSDNYRPLELVKSHIKDRIKALTADKEQAALQNKTNDGGNHGG